MAKQSFRGRIVYGALALIAASLAGITASAGTDQALGRLLNGRAIYVTRKITECKKVTSNLTANAPQPEKCEAFYTIKTRFRLIGKKLLTDVVGFERSGDASMKQASSENNGTVYIMGQKIDELHNADVPQGKTTDVKTKKASASALFRDGTLTLANDTEYTNEGGVLGTTYVGDTLQRMKESFAIGKDACSLKSFVSSSTVELTPESQGLLGGILPSHMTIDLRQILTDSDCSLEASE